MCHIRPVLRVAVIGSGPAGVYAASALTRSGGVSVDVLDRLPSPYGLVRYGVAPDHPKIQSISSALQEILEHPDIRFLGNVAVGTDLSLEDLHRHYDAVVFASGASQDRRLGVPGELLPGSFSATDFVAWYSGHPDAQVDRFTLEAAAVAVVGHGNVALDVARMLARSAEDLAGSDVPDHVLEILRRSSVEDIHLLGRRGPLQAKFTIKELRELGELTDVDVLVDPVEVALDEAGEARLAADPVRRRNVEVFRSWSTRRPGGRRRRVHVRFLVRPAEVLGESSVTGIRMERTALDGSGAAAGTGEFTDIAAQMILRSVGYRGTALAGLPFDETAGVVPNSAGRVLRDGVAVPGEYVTGWIKRGPTGIIGTNKPDAKETVASLLEDAPSLPPAPVRDPGAVMELLEDRGVRVVPWAGWSAIERAERELGETQGRELAKISDWEALLAIATADTGGDPTPDPA